MDYHEVFDEPRGRRSRHYYPSTTSSSSSTWTTTLASWLDLLTGPNFGIFVAVIVVIIMQYKGTLYNFYDSWQQDGWQGIVDVLFRQKETLRAYYQMACEFVRSWRHPQRAGGGGGGGGLSSLSLLRTASSAMPPPLVLPENEDDEEEQVGLSVTSGNGNGNGKHRKEYRSRLLSATTNLNGNRVQRSSSSLLPERDPSSPLLKKKNGFCLQSRQLQQEIEPAFLNEQDYPPGWLVYHPVLGVVPKEQADQYDKSHREGMPILSSSIAAGG